MARTMSKQLMELVQAATTPFQYAMSTKSGCECIAHALQSLTELNPRATVVSIDGISAYDFVSRESMLQALADVEGGSQALPFVSMFYGAPSQYLWEDSAGRVHIIKQGEGGEQGDAMMPLLLSLGQHSALLKVQEVFGPSREFVSTREKPRSGMQQARSPQDVMSWRGPK